VLRGSATAAVAGASLALLLPSVARAASSAGGTPPSDDAAASIYVEHVPAAGGTSGESGAAARNLAQLLTSPTLGAPQRAEPLPGGTDTAYGTFSFETVREVAGIGTARLAVLLAVLILITVTVGATAFTRLSKR
jgi:hypothetical protein